MSVHKVNAHHSSPGSPKDFFHLKLIMPNFDFHIRDRLNDQFIASNEENLVELGNSFGSYFALLSASENRSLTKHVFLIAPYFFHDEKLNPIKKVILKIGFLQKLALKKNAQKIVMDQIKKQASPKEIPESLLEASNEFSDTKRMAQAIIEKDINEKNFQQILKDLEKRKIPITMIYGKKDKIAREETHVDQLLRYKNISVEFIEDGGHGILWTHPEKIREIVLKKLEN